MQTVTEIWQTKPRLIYVTGEIGSGKTSWCRDFVTYARAQGADVRGLLSPGVFEHGQKVGIDLLDLASGQQRRLAHLRQPDDQSGILTRRWRFDADVLMWGNDVLSIIRKAELLIIDELGFMELEQGKGWTAALDLLDSGYSEVACVVVRSSLLSVAQARWGPGLMVRVGK